MRMITWIYVGLRGFFAGFPIQVTRDVIFYSSFFGSYDVICIYLKKYTSLSDPIIYFTAGGFSGQIAWALSIASDTIKSRIQTSSQVIAPGILEVAREIYRTQGYRGFFRGINVAIIRAFPANAALFMGYELTLKTMNHFF
jgi:solute carrier family 25 (mitochondrial carnitine/acylcarnitine transporter), member 20/29